MEGNNNLKKVVLKVAPLSYIKEKLPDELSMSGGRVYLDKGRNKIPIVNIEQTGFGQKAHFDESLDGNERANYGKHRDNVNKIIEGWKR